MKEKRWSLQDVVVQTCNAWDSAVNWPWLNEPCSQYCRQVLPRKYFEEAFFLTDFVVWDQDKLNCLPPPGPEGLLEVSSNSHLTWGKSTPINWSGVESFPTFPLPPFPAPPSLGSQSVAALKSFCCIDYSSKVAVRVPNGATSAIALMDWACRIFPTH